MSNDMYVTLPAWLGPTTAALLVERLLGGPDAGVRCRPDPDSCGIFGCRLDVTLPGVDTGCGFFFHADGDARGRRCISTTDCVFWRIVLGGLLRVVGGTIRNEYDEEPDVSERMPRVHLDLNEDANFEWLMRRCQRLVLPDPELVHALAGLPER